MNPPALPIPRALFSCSHDDCRQEVSYHADQLFWFEQENRWVCENCWDDLPAPADDEDDDADTAHPARGIPLDKYILAHNLPAAALLQPRP